MSKEISAIDEVRDEKQTGGQPRRLSLVQAIWWISLAIGGLLFAGVFANVGRNLLQGAVIPIALADAYRAAVYPPIGWVFDQLRLAPPAPSAIDTGVIAFVAFTVVVRSLVAHRTAFSAKDWQNGWLLTYLLFGFAFIAIVPGALGLFTGSIPKPLSLGLAKLYGLAGSAIALKLVCLHLLLLVALAFVLVTRVQVATSGSAVLAVCLTYAVATATLFVDVQELAARADLALPGLKRWEAAGKTLWTDVTERPAEGARKAFIAGDYGPARRLSTMACDAGNLESCEYLSSLALKGDGGSADEPLARKALERACGGKRMYSCYLLGLMLRDGLGGPKNELHARELFKTSCASGIADGCSGLGMLYYTGTSVKRDLAHARALFEQACNGQSSEGCYNLGRNLYDGEGGPKDLTRARELLEMSCNKRHAMSCNDLGVMYARGDFGRKDDKRARQLYDIACKGGTVLACDNLGHLLQAGRGGARDYAGARAHFERACLAGLSSSCSSLGIMLETGEGGPKDPVRARTLFVQACNGDNADGCYNLAHTFEEGLGGDKDLNRAKALYQKACDSGLKGGCEAAQTVGMDRTVDVVLLPFPNRNAKPFEIKLVGTDAASALLAGKPGENWSAVAIIGNYGNTALLKRGCRGFMTKKPNFTFRYGVRILPDIRVSMVADVPLSTLIVKAPNGHYYCASSSRLSVAGIWFFAPPTGKYEVWVSTPSQGQTVNAAIALITTDTAKSEQKR